MARWKLCTSITFESLPLSTCTLGQQKSLYVQICSTDFGNLCLSSKILRVGICVGSLRCACILLLQWHGENFAYLQNLKVCHFQPVPRCSKNPISPKVFTRFSKSLPQLHELKGGHLGGKFQARRYFTFAIARWKLCASTTFESLPLSTCILCQQKSYISKGIQPIFENFPSARRFLGWAFGWKISGAQVFYFCNAKVKTLRIDTIWKFVTYNLHTAPVKILYLQGYSSDFRNLRFSWELLREGTWLESLRCAGGLLLQWQGEKFAHRQHLKVCQFQPVHCARKTPYLQRYSSDFRILCLSSKLLRGGIWVERFRCAGTLLLQWQGGNVAHR